MKDVPARRSPRKNEDGKGKSPSKLKAVPKDSDQVHCDTETVNGKSRSDTTEIRTPQKVKNKKKNMTSAEKEKAISRRISRATNFPPDAEMNDVIKQHETRSTNNDTDALALRRAFWSDHAHQFTQWLATKTKSCRVAKPRELNAKDASALGLTHESSHE